MQNTSFALRKIWRVPSFIRHTKLMSPRTLNYRLVRLLLGRRVLIVRHSAVHIHTIPECNYHLATLPFAPLETTEAPNALHAIPIGDELVIGGISPSHLSLAGKVYCSSDLSAYLRSHRRRNDGTSKLSVVKLMDYSMRFEGTVYALGLHRTLNRPNYMPD
ncbi:hypothetical protein BDN71DRAFT_738317 [Pleurotus eryngii]|uniref:Uncharacterized protein n=1 Tax=Pleurotus eryngii TaxID=5323 RepID=A0A9P5ZG23_PLEER|nr:hypothetical protein BDN71DRAFT_738317 [Pleurotus eryngii]